MVTLHLSEIVQGLPVGVRVLANNATQRVMYAEAKEKILPLNPYHFIIIRLRTNLALENEHEGTQGNGKCKIGIRKSRKRIRKQHTDAGADCCANLNSTT